jgi:catechol 2,3-dioxygenase-like lactoylglutathione lyase family enzyme
MTPQFRVIGLVVEDMAASMAFYRRLGFDLPAGADAEPHVDHQLPGGLRISWDTVGTIQSFTPAYERPTSSGMALAFECADPAEVDSTYKELVGAGAHTEREPWDAFWGMRYATVLDPDGYDVDLFAPLKP